MEISRDEIRASTQMRCREVKDVANGYLGMKFNIEDLRDCLDAFLVDASGINNEDEWHVECAIGYADDYIEHCHQLYHEFLDLTRAHTKYLESTEPGWRMINRGRVYSKYEVDCRYSKMVDAARIVAATLTMCASDLYAMIEQLKCPVIDDRVVAEVLSLLKHFDVYDSFINKACDETTHRWALDRAAVKRDQASGKSKYYYVRKVNSERSEV